MFVASNELLNIVSRRPGRLLRFFKLQFLNLVYFSILLS